MPKIPQSWLIRKNTPQIYQQARRGILQEEVQAGDGQRSSNGQHDTQLGLARGEREVEACDLAAGGSTCKGGETGGETAIRREK